MSMENPFISVVINADTRAGFMEDSSTNLGMFDGCRSLDFLIDGVQNKINFFDGFDKEVILFIDEHHPIPETALKEIRGMVDTLVIRKHSKRFDDRDTFDKFNDLNYLGALQLARGEFIAHFDQDAVAFTKSHENVKALISLLGIYDFVCYPSASSPKCVTDASFDYQWASTRFFMCKRERLDFTEIMKCLLDYDYLYETYPASRKCSWLEHVLGLISKYKGQGVYYPQIHTEEWAVFCWNTYLTGTLRVLNAMTYENVQKYIERAGGITYNGIDAIKI